MLVAKQILVAWIKLVFKLLLPRLELIPKLVLLPRLVLEYIY